MASTCLHYFQSDWIDFWNKGLCKQGSLNNLKIDVILFDLETQYLSSNLRLFFSLKLPLLFGIEVPLQAFTFSGSFVPISLKRSHYGKNWRNQTTIIFQFWVLMGPMYNLGHFLAILGEFLAKKSPHCKFRFGEDWSGPKIKKNKWGLLSSFFTVAFQTSHFS